MKMFDTPVLFLIFNRPDTTQIVFNEIRKAEPKQLFIAADGPRKDHPEETYLCQKTRAIINQVDWDCKVWKFFRNENLGCKVAVSSAIDWFFSTVEEGIILEDDCVPDPSFFPFCQELLEKYREDERVMMISGINYLFNKNDMSESYFFSRYYPIWGWATWKRAWAYYDIKMSGWPEFNSQKSLQRIYCNKKIAEFLKDNLQKTYAGQINTWDFQWVYSCIKNNGLAICPKFNLVSNIGVQGSHANEISRFNFMPVKEVDVLRIRHPSNIIPNFYADDKTFDEILRKKSIIKRICKGSIPTRIYRYIVPKR
jgi:hypothetical protein